MAKPNKTIGLDRRLTAQEMGREPMDFAPYVPRLWEVTAVNTGVGTCTIRQAYKSSGGVWSLVARTARSVLYDPNNEPSVGDRGALLRTATGAQCFFSSFTRLGWSTVIGAATLNMVTSTVTSRTSCQTQRKWTATGNGTEVLRGVVKFAAPLTIQNSTLFMCRRSTAGFFVCVHREGSVTQFIMGAEGSGTRLAARLSFITSDFDPAVDSFATLSALPVGENVGDFHDWDLLQVRLYAHLDSASAWRQGCFHNFAGTSLAGVLVYGFRVTSIAGYADFAGTGTQFCTWPQDMHYTYWQYAYCHHKLV